MSNNGNDPWAWAGLLKWSLNHVDGTSDTSDVVPMSAEDKAFLEKVMKEGIIDEGDRMTFILTEAGKSMEYYKAQAQALGGDETEQELQEPPISVEALEELLQELRDIVEQIDFARAFCSLQGLPFLIGCATVRTTVPESIRLVCIGILSTLCQNNPPVQQQLLELGTIKTLSDLFFLDDTSNAMRAKIMQTISSMVRNHELAEMVFCSLPQAPTLIMAGLDPNTTSNLSQQLQTRTLFFLRALVTSDTATSAHIRTFGDAVACVVDHYLADDATTPPELHEMAIALLEQILEQKKGVNPIVQRKDTLAALGVQRISALRSLKGEDREFAQVELDHWEGFMMLLARAELEEETEPEEEKLLLEA
jgi:hsp70-interacting protein